MTIPTRCPDGELFRKTKKQIPPECIIQSIVLLQLRFIFAADLCQIWLHFGRIAPKLSHVSIALNLAIAETVSVALSHHQALMSELVEKARRHTNDAASLTLLLSTGKIEIREQEKREIASAANKKDAADNPHPPSKKHPVNNPPPPTRDSLHRRRRSRPFRNHCTHPPQ